MHCVIHMQTVSYYLLLLLYCSIQKKDVKGAEVGPDVSRMNSCCDFCWLTESYEILIMAGVTKSRASSVACSTARQAVALSWNVSWGLHLTVEVLDRGVNLGEIKAGSRRGVSVLDNAQMCSKTN